MVNINLETSKVVLISGLPENVNERERLQFKYRLDFIKVFWAEAFEHEYVLKSDSSKISYTLQELEAM